MNDNNIVLIIVAFIFGVFCNSRQLIEGSHPLCEDGDDNYKSYCNACLDKNIYLKDSGEYCFFDSDCRKQVGILDGSFVYTCRGKCSWFNGCE